MAAREKDLLNVEYFHVVFTIPDVLGPVTLQNKKLVYGILFRAASETLITIANDPKPFFPPPATILLWSWNRLTLRNQR